MDGEDLNKVKTANFVNALAGRVAGVFVNESAAGMGGAARVVMRGPKSLAQSNQPLYVVDGIPINNRSNDDIKSGIYSLQPSSEGISDINPGDVESVSVLSGAAAAALYGSAAAQGAVMIKTKSGRVGKTSVELSTSTQFLSPFVLPAFQNEYGNRSNEMKSWGTKRLSQKEDYTPNDFFRTGLNQTHNVALTAGTERNQVYLSLGSTTVHGIIPNNDFHRYNFSFKNVFSTFRDKLRLTFSFKYIKENDKNMLAQGQYFNPLTSVYLFPRGESFDAVKSFEVFDVARNVYLQNWSYGDDLKMQNPYWVANRMVKTTKRNRYLTDLSLKYDVTRAFSLEGRLRWDEAINKLEDKRYASTLDIFTHSPYGYYSYSRANDRSIYVDIMANISKQWTDLSFIANVGSAFTHTSYDITGFQGGLKPPSNLFTPNAIDYSRVSGDNRPIFDLTRHAIHSVLGSVELGWQEKVYLTVTGRNDWDSSLSNTAQQSFFYPSVGMSAILSKMLKLPAFVDFLKFRTSWASVGSAISPNISSAWRYEYIPSTGTYHTVTYKFPDNFYPERTNSLEAGVTATLFKEALSVKFTLYQSNTKNQTFLRQITLGGAYNREYIQAGNVRNRGLELTVGYNKKWTDCRWSVNMSYSMNHNRIVRLLDNPNETLRQGGLNGCEVILTQGGTMGDLYTFTGFKRNQQGDIQVNADGQVMQIELPTPRLVGSVLPKAHLGLNNTFSWKGLECRLLITPAWGGVCVSQTQAFMDSYGVSQKTATQRDNGGVVVGSQYVPTERYYTVVGGETPIWDEYVYDASNARIKEVYLSYTFDKLIRGAKLSVALTARNLLMLYCKAPFDPEATPSTDIYYQASIISCSQVNDHWDLVSTLNSKVMMVSRKLFLFFLCLPAIFSSCTGRFVDINRPGSKLSPDELKRDNYAVGSFLIQMQGVAFPEQENAYQTMIDFVGNYLGRYTTYTKELPKNHTLFNASNAWCAWPASYAPPIVSAFNEVVKLNGKENISYAWALILRAQAFLRFTDIYGPFPLSMNNGSDEVYSSQRDIYLQLINDLNEATTLIASDTHLAQERETLASYDLVYKGDSINGVSLLIRSNCVLLCV